MSAKLKSGGMECQVKIAEIAERVVRFIEYFPADAGVELVVLKGHLLIEELMSEIITLYLSKSNPLSIKLDRNIMFNNKLNICWALVREKVDEEFWKCLKEFNSIRNSMSHFLEPKGIEEKLEGFSKKVIVYSEFNNNEYPGRDL